MCVVKSITAASPSPAATPCVPQKGGETIASPPSLLCELALVAPCLLATLTLGDGIHPTAARTIQLVLARGPLL